MLPASVRFFSRLDLRYEGLARSLETSILRLALVTAVRKRPDQVSDFFSRYGQDLLAGENDWQAWFALAFIPRPETDPTFQVGATRCRLALRFVDGRNPN